MLGLACHFYVSVKSWCQACFEGAAFSFLTFPACPRCKMRTSRSTILWATDANKKALVKNGVRGHKDKLNILHACRVSKWEESLFPTMKTLYSFK